jgi:hypothetical protein
MRRTLVQVSALVGALAAAGLAQATGISETIYFTTFNGGGMDVWKTTATYNGNGTAGSGTFSPGTATNLASTPGADGIVFNPNNGFLLVGGQGNPDIYQVNPGTGAFTALAAGQANYEITVDPSGHSVWGGASEQALTTITQVSLTGAGPPNLVVVRGPTGAPLAITHITFAPGLPAGEAFYTSGGDNGFSSAGTNGTFGILNLSTGLATPLISGQRCTHGMVYDPFTGDLFVSGGNEICQINPTTDAIVSTALFGSTDVLDQGAVDGNGDLFWASNNGQFLFVDYSTTGLIGASTNFVSDNFYMSSLDDFAPLIGEGGSNNVPEPASFTLFALALAGVGLARHRRAH